MASISKTGILKYKGNNTHTYIPRFEKLKHHIYVVQKLCNCSYLTKVLWEGWLYFIAAED